MANKQYKSKEAAKLHARKVAKPVVRDSKKFKGGSNVHNGGSRGQSGQPRR
jgi:hypothetical protein